MEPEVRENWRRSWFGCLKHFADLQSQKEHWLDPDDKNPHWSFVEIICEYFDDCSLSSGYEDFVASGVVSEAERDLIQPWHDLLESYKHPTGDDYDYEAVLNDPAWNQLCLGADHIRRELLAIVGPHERAFLE